MKSLEIILLTLGLATQASAQRTIQLRPSCDTVSISYATGYSTSVDVINLPYKTEVAPSPGAPVHPILSDVPGQQRYRYHDGGPKINLLASVSSSKRAYAAELGSAGSSAILCTANVWASWLSARAQCRHEAEFMTEAEHQECLADALAERNRGDFNCVAALQRRIIRAILDCDDEIELFIQAYQGCSELDGHIKSWERYWSDEQ